MRNNVEIRKIIYNSGGTINLTTIGNYVLWLRRATHYSMTSFRRFPRFI